jgi:hypothetical protein
MPGAEQLRVEVRRYVGGEINVEDLENWLFTAEAASDAHEQPPDFQALASRVDLLIHQHWIHPESMPEEKLRKAMRELIDDPQSA